MGRCSSPSPGYSNSNWANRQPVHPTNPDLKLALPILTCRGLALRAEWLLSFPRFMGVPCPPAVILVCFAWLSALRGAVRVRYLAYKGRSGRSANIYLRYEGFLAYVAPIAGCWNSAVLNPPMLVVPRFWRFRQPLVSEIDVCNRPKQPLVTQIGTPGGVSGHGFRLASHDIRTGTGSSMPPGMRKTATNGKRAQRGWAT
jgi:hypothetical protein